MLQHLEATSSGGQASMRQPKGDYWASIAGSSGPPTRADLGKLQATVIDARLHVFVRQLLNPAEPAALREAFRATAAEGCDGLLDGKAEDVCRELGLWRVLRACLSVVFEGFHGFTGEGSLITRFRGLDRELVENAAARVQKSDDDGLIACMSLVQRWMGKQPTRWQAWADAIEMLGYGY
jgi:hypothetical protein